MRVCWLVVVAGCRLHFDPVATSSDGSTTGDATDAQDGLDGDGSAPLGPWSAPMPIPTAATAGEEQDVTGSSDKTEIYFAFGGETDLYVITRPTTADAFGARQPLSINTTDTEGFARLSPDDRTLYFASNRPGGIGGTDIWSTARAGIGQPWGTPQLVAGVSSTANDRWFTTCAGGRYVVTYNLVDLMEGVIGGGPPTLIAELDTSGQNTAGHLSPDCLTLYFSSNRIGNQFDLYRTTRTAIGMPWQAPEPLTDFNRAGSDEDDPWMSPDERMFLFTSDRSGNHDLYISTR